MSLIEVPGAKTLSRALLFRAILCIMGALITKLLQYDCLTPKHRETHECVVSAVATDAPVLKHQATNIHNADETFIVVNQFYINILYIKLDLWCTRLENNIKL